MTIDFPTTVTEATTRDGVVRAGGTDLAERRRLKLAPGPLVDLRDLPGLDALEWSGDGASVGAKLSIAALAADDRIIAGYPGLAEAAGGLATPQIRAVATVGGSLLQRTRCWYYRNPDAHCLKKGGSQCLARAGDHLYHACFDHSACAAVHPSTLGMALMAYDAGVEVAGAPARSVADLFGDGADPTRENTLEAGALLTHIKLPPPTPKERSAYFRSTARARAEWPLVEAIARLVVTDNTISSAVVAVGGVATVPLMRTKVAEALLGNPPTPRVLAQAAKLASDGAKPLPMTEYKVSLLEGTVREALERAVARPPTP